MARKSLLVPPGLSLVFLVAASLFLGVSSAYFGGDGAGAPPSFVRELGVPGSPWLVARCMSIGEEGAPQCDGWAYSVRAASWSWLALAVALTAGASYFKLFRGRGET